jgi:hypothetical protein
MPKHTISFAKIVSPPSATAWAQTYHAGNVYAVISVTQEKQQENPEHAIPSVHVLGKDIINNLEAEYFAIAEKSLQTIKEAVNAACSDIDTATSVNVLFAVINTNILYLFLYGTGQVYIKRNDKFGILLQQENKQQVLATSGFLQHGDTIVLASKQFTTVLAQKDLEKEMTEPLSEIGEKLGAQFDDEKYAGAAAIIFSMAGEKEPNKEPIPIQTPIAPVQKHPIADKNTEEEKLEEKATPEPIVINNKPEEEKLDLDERPHFAVQNTPEPKKEKTKRKFSFRQFFFLLLTVILAGVLLTAMLISTHKQQNNQAQTLFASEFPSAKQHFDEGQSLLPLNKNLAQDDFAKAKTMLENLQSKLPTNSPEGKQVTDLLAQVNQVLTPTAGEVSSKNLIPEETTASPLLAAEIANATGSYFAQDENGIYVIDEKAIASITSSNKATTLITNTTWNDLGGFGTYLGNFYVLDKKANQIIKFTKADTNYGKTNYFAATPPDLSKAVSLAIDGSIWIVFADGSVKQFTKGQQEQFSLQKLDKPFMNPTRIVTSVDMDNVYILDNGNSRIVAVKKEDGTVVGQYAASELKNAKDIDVDEKNKKIFVLINNKIFSIPLQ